MCKSCDVKLGENRWDRDIINIVQKEQVLAIPKLKMKDAYDLVAIMRIFLKIAVDHKLGFDRWLFIMEPNLISQESYRIEVNAFRTIKLLSGSRETVGCSIGNARVRVDLLDIPLTTQAKIKQKMVTRVLRCSQIESKETCTSSAKALFKIKPPSLTKRERIIRQQKVGVS